MLTQQVSIYTHIDHDLRMSTTEGFSTRHMYSGFDLIFLDPVN